MRTLGFSLLVALGLACGVPQEEHDKALADQKSAYEAEMKKMQEAASSETEKRDRRIGQLETEVGKLGGNLAEIRKEADALDEKLGKKQAELVSAKATIATTEEQLQATKTELEEVRRLREQAERAAKAFKDLAARLKSMVDAGQLEVVTRNGRMMLKLPDDILFPSGSDQLKKEGKAAIEGITKVLTDVPDRAFLIAGHTDNVPIRSKRFRTNWDLSTARAVEVVKLMIAAGMAPERVAAAGYGEFDPVAANDSPENKSKNRRLEIILMPNLEELPSLSAN